jgi:hypothetical protein
LSIKPNKNLAVNAAIELTPQYTELIRDLQKGRGRPSFPPEIFGIQNKLGAYVLHYDNELKIGCALFLGIFGEQGFREFCKEINAASSEEQQQFLDEVIRSDGDIFDEPFSSFEIPRTPTEWADARAAAEALPEEERKIVEKQGAFFWTFFFGFFFNTLALMVHGAKMTSLVPLAMSGDDDAFLKAVQIDRMLLLHHPYFRDRKFRAQNDGETKFLSKLAYRESSSPLHGKIQYPGLYILFGILDSFQWLNDLKHEEILDICDAAGLDRYQNRIEDVNYITKRLTEYRRGQKYGTLSMH